jgi:LuxR family maltose regulon positive regulatory protein
LERLDAAVEGKSTLVQAPAGFGKSMLLRQWVANHKGAPLAWLSLDARDEDGGRLATRLVGALSVLERGIGTVALERVARTGTMMGDQFVAQLLEELELVGPGVLVVDEVDSLTNPRIHLELRALVEHSPDRFRILVGARVEPLLLEDRTPSHGPTTTFGREDLAFGHDEARLLLERLSGQALTERHIDHVMKRTEGWPAALQLAGLALRDRSDPEQFIESFTGEDQYIAAYLTEEVLGRQPEAVRRFLLTTSVLTRLAGPLCDAVTGDRDGREMLELVHRGSMFVDRVDDTGPWFRYHRLFGELLRHELRIWQPELERDLLCRAAEWHLGQGDIEGAAHYFIEAEDWDRTLEVVTEHGRDLYEQGRATTVLRWLEAVPAAIRSSRPEVLLQEAVLDTMAGNTLAAADVVERLTRSAPVAPGALAVVNSLRAIWVQWHATPGSAIEATDDLLDFLDTTPAEDIPDVFGITSRESLRAVEQIMRGRVQWYVGDTSSARDTLRAFAASDLSYAPWRLNALGALALLDAWSGRLHDAHQAAAQALVLATRVGLDGHQANIDAHLAMGHVLRERGLLGRSQLALDSALAPAARIQRSAALAVHAIECARLDLAEGQPRRGLERIARFLSLGHARAPHVVAVRMRVVEARLWLAAGDLAAAERLLETEDERRPEELAVAVQLAVAKGDLIAAQALLESWTDDGELRSTLDHGLWTAVVDNLAGDRRSARRRMADVVALAEPEGHVRLFRDAGPAPLRLLRSLLHASPTPYLRRLVQPDPVAPHPGAGGGDAVPALSGRELLVLSYLPSRLSNAEIAAELYVSLNTVKTHLRSIYRRLGVSGRRDAVERATALGLV